MARKKPKINKQNTHTHKETNPEKQNQQRADFL